MDKQTMEAFGFTMVPEASIKLAGAPECQSQDITITIQSSKKWMAEGLIEVTLPLLVKGGPAVLLTLRAVVVVPDLQPSVSLLDFGVVQTSHCKVKLSAI
jgi:hydrocephalus-inducing protein